MNLPRELTVSRFVLTVLLLLALSSHSRLGDTLALIIFIAGGLTDLFGVHCLRRARPGARVATGDHPWN